MNFKFSNLNKPEDKKTQNCITNNWIDRNAEIKIDIIILVRNNSVIFVKIKYFKILNIL